MLLQRREGDRQELRSTISIVIAPQSFLAAPLLEVPSSIHRLHPLRPLDHLRQVILLRPHLPQVQRAPEIPRCRPVLIKPPVQPPSTACKWVCDQ
jgi:hypothetical protein